MALTADDPVAWASSAALTLTQSIPPVAWFKLVNDTVTEPYLDEVFHVRQAQHYCEGYFDVWDPKITTPPGLYMLSYPLSLFPGCGLVAFRCVALGCLIALPIVVSQTYTIRQTGEQHGLLARHSALNIALFPPLFFFSALYYTDVPSTLSVLLFHWFFLHSNRRSFSPWVRTPLLLMLGLVSLSFRQTNIFWVAIFPAGIVLINALDRGHQVVKDSMYKRAEGFGDSLASVLRTCWKMEVVFDPAVRDAWIEDYDKTILSIVASGIKACTQPKRIFNLAMDLAPYTILIAIFGAFVVWNGGVVLGDKSNHIATIHLPQMLYIWPYFTFFSWPLLYPYLATFPMALMATMPNLAPLEALLMFKRRYLAPRAWVLGAFLATACVTVHFNTIVHPFTLADNRHYTFYVFRLLTKPVWMKYVVTPIYILTAWSCIQALSARPRSALRSDPPQNTAEAGPERSTRPFALPDGQNPATVSFVLIWLATTTLQLVTAPLVEPRYFILPWIFWRMHVPLQQYTPPPTKTRIEKGIEAQDHRLWLETIWFALVNAATGYIFLQWGFGWPQEPGKVQRFMW